MINIESSKIKVFPSNRRNDEKDRNARLFNEQNITGIVKGVTNKNFVISGLDIQNNELRRGECSIGGYYFNIDISQTLDTPSSNVYIYLRVTTTPITINSPQITFNQLIGITYNSSFNISAYNLGTLDTLDVSNNNNYNFEGLNLIYTDTQLDDISNDSITDTSSNITYSITHYNLLLGQYDITNTKWLTNPNNKIKYTEEDATLDDGEIPYK